MRPESRHEKYNIMLVVRHPVGGIRTFFCYVYKNFDARRYRFTLVSPELPETRVLLEDLKALDLVYIPTAMNASNKDFFTLVSKIIRSKSFDLIHSHGFTSGICSIAGALSKRTPHILTCHDVFTQQQFIGFQGFLKKIALGTMLSLIDCIHCVSYDARDNLLAYLPILRLSKRKAIAIANGIEVEPFLNAENRDLKRELGLRAESFLIGFLGRFMSQKGFRYLVHAVEDLKKENNLTKDPVVVSFGEQDGFIREEKQDLKNRGLEGSFIFLPFVRNVASTLKGLDIVAMPSLWEACPLLPMEAMVAGVPVVGTDCVGLREVLRETPAHIVPAKDSRALAEVLAMEIRNPTTGKAKRFAIEAAARFCVIDRAAEIEKLMLKFIER